MKESMVGSKATRAVSILFGDDPWIFPASLLLHALLLLALGSLLAPRILPALIESIPVEIWSPEDWAIVGTPSSESVPSEMREATPALAQPGAPMPQSPDPIRATTMLSSAALAHPQSRAMRTALERMDEETRLEQLCGIEAMAQIAAHLQAFKPDRIVAYAKADVRLARNILIADGAAFRSGREWHEVKFTCEFGANRRNVQAFEFTVGNAIPKRDWERYNLPDPAFDTD
ncbi:DUF930 domain-containing protein [Microvirga solisilvae]|uniref:DUF930 domain-containing protein n=1 Tax=Microvirga solisilvae TaxID=2919498 RepID=UPI001FAF88DF|nr:DUF930 domain-containing protein [Microvirga solisilvae]